MQSVTLVSSLHWSEVRRGRIPQTRQRELSDLAEALDGEADKMDAEARGGD